MLTKRIEQFVLSNGGIRVGILDLGATISFLEIPDRQGRLANVVAGFPGPEQYWQNDYYFGCVVGRYANRIGGGCFLLDGHPVQLSVNNAGNHLHGGFEGFHRRFWTMKSSDDFHGETGIVLEYRSPDEEEGYPGNLRATVSYWLDSQGCFRIDYEAVCDQPTPVNLTNHTYFNLSGFTQPTILDHQLKVFAGTYTEKNAQNLPTGRILPVTGTPLDFTTPKRIGEHIDTLVADKGFDHNYVLDPSKSGIASAAELYDPVSGRFLRVRTDRPGIQVYTANWWDGSIVGQQGVPYLQHGAVALETQAFPDSPHQPSFPDTILRPGTIHQTSTIFEFNIR